MTATNAAVKILVAIFQFAFLHGLVCAGDEMDDPDYRIVCSCKKFQTGRIGEDGQKSRIASAYLRLVNRGGSSRSFVELFKSAKNSSVKVYALQGLFETDVTAYKKWSKELDDKDVVECVWFGVLTEMSGREIKRLIKSGQIGRALRWPQ